MKKEKVMLYEQRLKPSDLFLYIPRDLKRKLSDKDRKIIEKAFSQAILAYQKRYEDNYLNRMLI